MNYIYELKSVCYFFINARIMIKWFNHNEPQPRQFIPTIEHYPSEREGAGREGGREGEREIEL
jgi:hypothetical protein